MLNKFILNLLLLKGFPSKMSSNIVLCEIDFTTLNMVLVQDLNFMLAYIGMYILRDIQINIIQITCLLVLFLVILFPARNAGKMHVMHGKYDQIL